ncbi:Uncharacterised protein [Staphylococcus aureus]|nr:Uncharacterised protein [Staphylococcus aureus]
MAILLAISVLPTPVGPIIKIFLGEISCFDSSSNKLLLYRLRKAIATLRLASFCPTMYSFNLDTISFGVNLIPAVSINFIPPSFN